MIKRVMITCFVGHENELIIVTREKVWLYSPPGQHGAWAGRNSWVR